MGKYKRNSAAKAAKIDFFKRQQYLRELEPTLAQFTAFLEENFDSDTVAEILSVRSEYAFRRYCNKHGISEGGPTAQNCLEAEFRPT